MKGPFHLRALGPVMTTRSPGKCFKAEEAQLRSAMRHVHLITVGASIITNLRRLKAEDKRLVRLASDDAELLKRAHRGDVLFEAAYEMLKERPREMSAELNSLWPYVEHGLVDEAYLYYTQTGAGNFCSSLLELYMREELRLTDVHTVEVKGFGLDFEEGLVNLMDKVASKVVELRSKPGVAIYLNATGGFKPENAILVLVASMLGLRSIYYMHEAFKEPVALPVFPISVRKEPLECLRWIEGQVKLQGFAVELEAREKFGDDMVDRLLAWNLVEQRNGRLVLKKWTKAVLKAISH